MRLSIGVIQTNVLGGCRSPPQYYQLPPQYHHPVLLLFSERAAVDPSVAGSISTTARRRRWKEVEGVVQNEKKEDRGEKRVKNAVVEHVNGAAEVGRVRHIKVGIGHVKSEEILFLDIMRTPPSNTIFSLKKEH